MKPSRRLISILAITFLAGASIALACFWRPWLAGASRSIFADELGCSVELSRVDVSDKRLDFHDFRVYGCRDFPQLIEAQVSRLSVMGGFGQMRSGRFERVELGSTKVHLSIESESGPSELPALPDIGELFVDEALVFLRDEDTRSDLGTLELSAFLSELATTPEGKISVETPIISLSTLAQLGGFESPEQDADFQIHDLSVSLLPAPADFRVRASAARLTRTDGVVIMGPEIIAQIDLPSIRLEILSQSSNFEIDGTAISAPATVWLAQVTVGPDLFDLQAEAKPSDSGFGSIEIGALWNLTDGTDSEIDASVSGLQIERFFPSLGFAGELDLWLLKREERTYLHARISPSALVEEGTEIAFMPHSSLDARLELDERGLKGEFSARSSNLAPRGHLSGMALPEDLNISFDLLGTIATGPSGKVTIGITAADAFLGSLGRLSSKATFELGVSTEALGELNWTSDDLPAALDSVTFGSNEPPLPFSLATGSGHLRAIFDSRSQSRISGSLALEDLSGTSSGELIGESEAESQVTLSEGLVTSDWSLDLETLELRFDGLEGRAQAVVPAIGTVPVSLLGASAIVAADHAELTKANLEFGEFGSFALRASSSGETINVALDAEDLPAETWIRTFHDSDDLELSGSFRLELDAHRTPDSAWFVDFHVGLEQLGSSSANGARVLDGLDGDFDLVFTSSPARLALDGRLSGFLVLWDELFVDFSELSTSVEASLSLLDETGWSLDTTLTWPHDSVGRFSAFGSESSTRPHTVRAEVSIADLDAYRRSFFPDLPFDVRGRAALNIDGYTLDAGAWQLDGNFELDNIDVIGRREIIELSGLDLDLPITIAGRAESDFDSDGDRVPTSPREGWIQFESLRVRDLRLPATASSLAVGEDWIQLEEPVEVGMFGGIARLQHIHAFSLYSEDRRIEASLSLLGADLEQLTLDLQLFPLSGGLDLDLARIVVDRQRLVADGGGKASLLGGDVEIHDISGERIFSRFPELTFSADFRNLDLHQLTAALDLGLMTGRIGGNIRRCELFRGIPVRFDATFETVIGKGIPRFIDVEAVNNLSILGTGSSLGFLNSGIRRYFSRYTYRRLAVDVELAKDVLLLRGGEKRGDRELFLRGRLPFPIDIVNAQPGRTVSFEAMTRRLRSLGQ